MNTHDRLAQLTSELLGIKLADGVGSYVDGSMLAGLGEPITLIDPASGKAFAQYKDAGPAVVDAAAQSATHGQRQWKSLTPGARGEVLWKIGQALRAVQSKLAELESISAGKPIRDTRGEVLGVAKMFEYYAGWCDKIYGEVIPVPTSHLNYTKRQPYGVILQITPWNAPLSTCGWQVAPALCTGNAALLKPSEFTPLSSLVVAKLATQAGLPDGAFNVIAGLGHTTGQAAIEHKDTHKVVFIGSPENGSRIAASAAKSVKPCLLELGGKSANIIFADADLDRAAIGAQQAIFAAAGQSCVAGSRLLVERSVYDAFLEKVAADTAKIPVGAPTDPKTQVGPVQNARQYERIGSMVSEASNAGADILVGGGRPEALSEGYYFNPTVLANVATDAPIAHEEVFGPVLSAIPFSDEDEAVAIANNTRFGLAGAVWTNDVARAHRVADAVNAGTFWVNGYKTISVMSPFGGFGQSGYGRSSGKEVLEEYSLVKSVWVETAKNPPVTFGYAADA